MLIWIFWCALFLTVYTYLLFPLILAFLVKIRHRQEEPYQDEQTGLPSVAVLCAMYNEEKVVRDKVENFLKIKYNNIKMYIGSDGSSDDTNTILRSYVENNKIAYYEFPRRGKVYVINDLMAKVKEEVVVFTDANSMFEPDTVNNLIKYFRDPRIGAICGRLKLMSSGGITGEGFYWKYETAIKRLENILDCVIGANGAIYAVRRKLLKLLPANTINDDFTNSMRVIEQGYGVKYAEDAVAYEEVNQNDVIEFKRHVRDGAGHYRAIMCLYKLLNPFKPKVFFLYVSHRIIRWLVPFFMILLLVLPLYIEWNPFLHSIYITEIAFYLVALFVWITKTKMNYLYFPFYFVYINIALFMGFLRIIFGIQKVAWSSTKR